MKPFALYFCATIYAFGYPALAADYATANAGVRIINSLEIEKASDLSFGTIVANKTSGGDVSVLPNSDGDQVCADNLTCLEQGSQAKFLITGKPFQQISVRGPNSVTLLNETGDEMIVDTFSHTLDGDAASWRGWEVLDSNGVEDLNVGAVLRVSTNQAPGTYVGTFTISVEYQ